MPLIITKSGEYAQHQVLPSSEKEIMQLRTHLLSRGNDPDIYRERKMLGKLIVPRC